MNIDDPSVSNIEVNVIKLCIYNKQSIWLTKVTIKCTDRPFITYWEIKPTYSNIESLNSHYEKKFSYSNKNIFVSFRTIEVVNE